MENFVAGKHISQSHYKSFQPNGILNYRELSNMEVYSLLSKADRHLGRLDMYSKYVDIDMFISIHIAKEATQSSKIEGTQTNIEETFLSKDEVASEKRNDWEEVNNYIAAMDEAVGLLAKLPFSSRLIKKIHKVLLQGVRGEHKQPGEFRRSQNWIGGATLKDAVFIPPVHTSINDLMADLEKFANDEENPLPDLLKVALVHYQFETIHPFLDGNGRVGRLLITLYLVDKGILKSPILYLSDFFERNRMLYYDNLMRARTHNDINQWFKFFLAGVIETAKKGHETLDNILQLKKRLESVITILGIRSRDAEKVLAALYKRPVIEVATVEAIIKKSNVSAYKLIADLESLGILEEITGGQRSRVYAFREYLDLFK